MGEILVVSSSHFPVICALCYFPSKAVSMLKWILPTAILCSAVSMASAEELSRGVAWQELDTLVADAVTSHTAPGAYLVVGNKEGVLHEYFAGRHTYDPASPAVTPDTIFDLASLSKLVGTGTSALVLMTDGKLAATTPVSSILPGFEANGKESVTVLDLGRHTSGLKAYENSTKVEAARAPSVSHPDALIAAYCALPLANPPHGKVVYSCLNFQLLARVNETVAGRRQESLLRERIFGPLGMKDTGYLLTDEQLTRTMPTQEGVAPGTTHDPLARYHGSVEHCPGNAGLFSTGPDLAKFCLMMINRGEWDGKRYLDRDLVEWSFNRHTDPEKGDGRGFIWDLWEAKPYVTGLNKEQGRRIVGHTGYTGTMIWIDLYTNTWFVLLTNRTWPDDGKEGSTAIAALRKGVADKVLRMQPEYAEWFAEVDSAPTPAE
jgi:CubicO group peptidase (beta-lactamase class C family)